MGHTVNGKGIGLRSRKHVERIDALTIIGDMVYIDECTGDEVEKRAIPKAQMERLIADYLAALEVQTGRSATILTFQRNCAPA